MRHGGMRAELWRNMVPVYEGACRKRALPRRAAWRRARRHVRHARERGQRATGTLKHRLQRSMAP